MTYYTRQVIQSSPKRACSLQALLIIPTINSFLICNIIHTTKFICICVSFQNTDFLFAFIHIKEVILQPYITVNTLNFHIFSIGICMYNQVISFQSVRKIGIFEPEMFWCRKQTTSCGYHFPILPKFITDIMIENITIRKFFFIKPDS